MSAPPSQPDPFFAPKPKLRKIGDTQGAPDEEAVAWRAAVEAATAYTESCGEHGRATGVLVNNQLALDATAVNILTLRGRDAERVTCRPKQRSESRIVKAVEWPLDVLAGGLWLLPASMGAVAVGAAMTDRTHLCDAVASAEAEELAGGRGNPATRRAAGRDGAGEPRPDGLAWRRAMRDTELFPQVQTLDAVHRHWDECRRMRVVCSGIAALQPGCGKTTVGWRLAWERVLRHGGRVAFVAGKEDLVIQTVAEAFECMTGGDGLSIGVAKAGRLEVDPAKFQCVVFSLQTLESHERRKGAAKAVEDLNLGSFDMVIWDEAHHMVAKGALAAHRMFNARYNLYLSATPNRDDGLSHELRAVTGPVLYRSAMNLGTLNVLRVRYLTQRDVPKTFDDCLDYNALQDTIARDGGRNEWGARVAAQMVAAGHTVLVTTLRASIQVPDVVKRIHAALMAQAARAGVGGAGEAAFAKHPFTFDGVPYTGPLIACTMSEPSFAGIKDKEERAAARAAFRASLEELQALPGVLAVNSSKKGGKRSRDTHGPDNVPLMRTFLKYARVIVGHVENFSEGFNAPQMSCLVTYEGFSGESRTVQLANRVTRVHDGKPCSYLVDIADDVQGLPTPMSCQAKRCRVHRTALRAQVVSRRVPRDTVPSPAFWSSITRAFPAAEGQDFGVPLAFALDPAPAGRRDHEAAPEDAIVHDGLDDDDARPGAGGAGGAGGETDDIRAARPLPDSMSVTVDAVPGVSIADVLGSAVRPAKRMRPCGL